jgi:hypothetical protein
MSASRPVTATDASVPAPSGEHFLPLGGNGALDGADDDYGQPYTLWEKFVTHTGASTWPATSPATLARPR